MLSGCQIATINIRGSDGIRFAKDTTEGDCKSRTSPHDFRIVKTVDLSHSKLEILSDCSYLSLMFHLEELNLAHNAFLSALSRESFTNLGMLKILDLSFIGLIRLESDEWDELNSLENLSLNGSTLVSIKFILPATIERLNIELTNIADVAGKVFSKVCPIKRIRSSTYKLCCPDFLGQGIPAHICSFTGRAISSCEDLISEPALLGVVWFIALSTLVGNAVTLVYRLTWDKEVLKKSYDLFVSNLGITDFIIGYA